MPARPYPSIGGMDQWVEWQSSAVVPVPVSTLTAAAGLATAITEAAHGYHTGDEILIGGVDQIEYGGPVIVTVLDAFTFTYRVVSTAPPTATGTITATYIGDGAGGAGTVWRRVAVIPAEVRALNGFERIQAGAIQANVAYHVRTWATVQIKPQDRLLWETRILYLSTPALLDGDSPYVQFDCIEGQT